MTDAQNENENQIRCVICDQPGAVEMEGNGKPWCAECTALPEHERRLAGLKRMARAEIDQPLVWHYLSFADESGFLGASWVKARGMLDAIQISHARGCNGGGSVMCRPLPRHGEPPPGSAYVLHRSKDEVQRLFDRWTARIN